MKRIFSLDILRVIAVVMVVTLHILAYPLVILNSSSADWWLSNLLIAPTRVCVPIFFMLSGAFIINCYSKEGWKYFFNRRILRLVVSLIFWSLICFLYLWLVKGRKLEFFTTFVSGFWHGRGVYYHLYFLYVLVEIYLFVPIIMWLINKSEIISKVVFIVILIISSVDLFRISLGKLGFGLIGLPGKGTLFISFVGYFYMGYFLRKCSLKIKNVYLISIFIISSLLVAFSTYVLDLNSLFFVDKYFTSSYFSPFVIIGSWALFLYFKNLKVHPSKAIYTFVSNFVTSAMGIYLIHPLILDFVSNGKPGEILFGYSPILILTLPLTLVVVLTASYLIIYFIKKATGAYSRFLI